MEWAGNGGKKPKVEWVGAEVEEVEMLMLTTFVM
jgi:hypothetical protein